ncbi:MAG TPA: ribosome assembly factor SBDS [Alphaproteobacteria bacterium]|nr:ribosome assembly factor SBDS [Alphaproteobacteria bacterium]
MGRTQNFSKKAPEIERLHVNLAKIKKNGRKFEIVIDPDNAIRYKEGLIDDIKDVLIAERVFEDAQKGAFSPKSDLELAFPGKDELEVADIILMKGMLQLSAKYRESKREEKLRKVIELIHRNGVNPQNNLPHPVTRIQNAFEEAKVKIDDNKSAEDQVQAVIKQIQKILPINVSYKHVSIHISEKYAKKYYKNIHKYGRVLKEKWVSDGHYTCILEVPAGLYMDLIDELNSKTHGGAEIKLLDPKNHRFLE